MLENIDIINHIEELLYIVTDSNHNIIIPKEQIKINKILQLIENKNNNNYIYNNNKCYKYYEKIIKNGKYKIEYLIDITELEKKLEIKYQNDVLTSVLTRSTMLQKINQKLLECENNNYSFSIVIADIDHFKEVNDLYGHLTGDEVLKKIGKILSENTNDKDDLVGRYGGEEFLFFFKNIDLNDTISKIIKIKNTLDKINFTFQDKKINNITMSFGVYHINDLKNKNFTKTNIISKLINCADIALYKSKQGGRNLTHIYSDDGTIKKVEYK